MEFRLVPTWDGLYTPIASCLPVGDGPHAVVLLAFGNGGGGLPWVRGAVRSRDPVVRELRGGPLTRDVRSGREDHP